MTHLNNTLISIIVPVYNASKYLRECINSISKQSYRNIEILLVDDGSSDNSLRICNELSEFDNRIKVLAKKNGGASSARNFGIDAATGEWIAFVDSDDLIQPFYIEHLLNAVKESDVDFVVSGIQYWNVKTNERQNLSYKRSYLIADKTIEAITKNKIHLNGGPVSKLYKASIVKDNNIYFNENMSFAEDCDFMLRYFSHIRSIAFIENSDYVYRLTPNSLSHRQLSYETELYCLNEMVKRYNDIHRLYTDSNLNEYKASVMQYFLRTVRSANRSNITFKECLYNMNKIYELFVKFYLNEEYRIYRPYCRNEMLIYNLFTKKHLCATILYCKYMYTIFKRLKA